jgi:RNA-splicing ligase RtcB
MFEIRTERVPIKLWLDTLEEGALAQAKNIANLPDAHQGFGMPIGGILATRDAVIPNAVGVDIGGGNHFIELQQGSDGRVWIMLHSGSRNFGYTIAKEYYRRAKDLNKAAQRSLDLKKERARMDRRGIIHNLRSAKDLDEAAGAESRYLHMTE